jgi:hypothetical protein
LTLAAGIKIWPLLLLPFSLRPLLSNPKRLVLTLILYHHFIDSGDWPAAAIWTGRKLRAICLFTKPATK